MNSSPVGLIIRSFPYEAPKGGKGLRIHDPPVGSDDTMPSRSSVRVGASNMQVVAEAHALVLQAVHDCHVSMQEASAKTQLPDRVSQT